MHKRVSISGNSSVAKQEPVSYEFWKWHFVSTYPHCILQISKYLAVWPTNFTDSYLCKDFNPDLITIIIVLLQANHIADGSL